MKPISSATTGIAKRAQQAEKLIGEQPGATGSALTLSGDPERGMHPVVTSRPPKVNTDAALSRMQQFGVTCSVKTEMVFPEGMNGEATFRQMPVSLTVTTASSADLFGALAVMQEALYPAPREQIEEWLAELSVKTARRRETGNEAELALSVYTSHLREYPADAVRHVLRAYRGTWFPTWGELATALEEYVEPRLMIRDRLQDMIDGGNRYTEKALQHDPIAERLAMLREQLEAADRLAAKYPETEEVSLQKRDEYAEEIRKLELGN